MTATEWEPGDPLHRHPRDVGAGRQHVRRIIQLIPLGDHEACNCQDAARWPEPLHGSHLRPTEALLPVWGEP